MLRRWFVFVVGGILLLGNGCSSARTTKTLSTPTPLSTVMVMPTPTISSGSLPIQFPAFHDWRAAYQAPDGHFHAVSLDGKTDSIGPVFPQFEYAPFQLFSAGASNDGSYVAFLSNPLIICNIQASSVSGCQTSKYYIPSAMFWAPNSLRLAIGRDNLTSNSTHIITVTSSTLTDGGAVPTTSIPITSVPIYPEGWIDNQTLLTYTVAQGNNTVLGVIQAMDSTTGAKRMLLTFPNADHSNALFTLSPDGKEALWYNYPAHAMAFTPYAAIIDTATSAVHPLPNLVALEAQQNTWISGAAWRPGTHTLAVTIGFDDQPGVKTADWLVDTDHDAETAFPAGAYVEQWSPDGMTLVLSNAPTNENRTNQGPITLAAVTFSPSGQATLTTLTKDSLSFTFLGFIRSA